MTKAAARAPAPDFVVFNGVANQYKDHPLEVATGKTVRFFLLDAGPGIDSSFHIVGTIFDSVIKEGVQLNAGNRGHFGSQAVDLSPAQGAIIELTTAEDGLYPIVTHAFNFVGLGALGLLQAGDGDPAQLTHRGRRSRQRFGPSGPCDGVAWNCPEGRPMKRPLPRTAPRMPRCVSDRKDPPP